MKKEEVLKRNRLAYKQSRNRDEGIEYAENKGYQLSIIILTVFVAFMLVFELFFGEGRTITALIAISFISFSALAYERFRFTKDKLYLFSAAVGSLAVIINLINYVKETLR